MTTWQIILAIIIVGLSIVTPIYYSSKRKKQQRQEELNKIKAYMESINQFTRNKHNEETLGILILGLMWYGNIFYERF